jgi:hypothetical protein
LFAVATAIGAGAVVEGDGWWLGGGKRHRLGAGKRWKQWHRLGAGRSWDSGNWGTRTRVVGDKVGATWGTQGGLLGVWVRHGLGRQHCQW